MTTCRPGSSRDVECASPAAANLEMEDPKPSHGIAAKRMRVLVMGDEAADVSAFLRAATNSSNHKRIVTLSEAVGRRPAASYVSLRDLYVDTSADRDLEQAIGNSSRVDGKTLKTSSDGASACAAEYSLHEQKQKVAPDIVQQLLDLEVPTWESLSWRNSNSRIRAAPNSDSGQLQSAVCESLSPTTSTITAADSDGNQPQSAVCESLSSMTAADSHRKQLEIAVWESLIISWSSTTPTMTAGDSDSNHQMVFEFRQLLDVNLFPMGGSGFGKYDGGIDIDPLDVHSGIRAQLNIDFPANANTKAAWDKWWDEDGIHLCVVVLSTNGASSLARDHDWLLLRHFLSRYYGLHSVPDADNEVAACSPAPLLIILGGMRRSTVLRRLVLMTEIQEAITDVLRPAINEPGTHNYRVIHWPVEAEEEAAVCGYVKENIVVVGGVDARAASCTQVRIDGISRQYQILQEIWTTAGIPTSSCPWLHVPERNSTWMIERCFKLLHGRLRIQSNPRTLNILSCIWRLPPNLKEALTTLMLSDKVPILDILLCIIVFCKREDNDRIMIFEDKRTAQYYSRLVRKALMECQSTMTNSTKVDAVETTTNTKQLLSILSYESLHNKTTTNTKQPLSILSYESLHNKGFPYQSFALQIGEDKVKSYAPVKLRKPRKRRTNREDNAMMFVEKISTRYPPRRGNFNLNEYINSKYEKVCMDIGRGFELYLTRFADRSRDGMDAKELQEEEDRAVVLCKAFIDPTTTDISGVNAVELLFQSADAMSRFIGVGVHVDGAMVVRHSRGSVAADLQPLPQEELHSFLHAIPREEVGYAGACYLPLELISGTRTSPTAIPATFEDDSHTDLTEVYGVEFQLENARARYSVIAVGEASAAESESNLHLEISDGSEAEENDAYGTGGDKHGCINVQSNLADLQIGDSEETEGELAGDEEGCSSDGAARSCDDEGEPRVRGRRRTSRGDERSYRKRQRCAESHRERGNGRDDDHGRRNSGSRRWGGNNGGDGRSDGNGGHGGSNNNGGNGGGQRNGDIIGGARGKLSRRRRWKKVNVILPEGGVFDGNRQCPEKLGTAAIAPQFTFTFQVTREGDRRISIVSATQFSHSGDREWYHDDMELKIGPENSGIASLDLMSKPKLTEVGGTAELIPMPCHNKTSADSESKATTKTLGGTAGPSCVNFHAAYSQTITKGSSNSVADNNASKNVFTICKGFFTRELSNSHCARFKLEHTDKARGMPVRNPSDSGLYATVTPFLETTFEPMNMDKAAPYTFQASQRWGKITDDQWPPQSDEHMQTYVAKFLLNHEMTHIQGNWRDVEEAEFVTQGRRGPTSEAPPEAATRAPLGEHLKHPH